MRSSRTTFGLHTLVAGLILSLFVAGGCSELSDNLPPASGGPTKIHPDGWVNQTSPDFHGAYLKTKNWQVGECAACHGGDFQGGSSQVSCLACHSAFPHSVVFTQAAGYHPGYLRANLFPLTECQSCHGTTYQGGTLVDVSCTQSGCHVDASDTPKIPEACNTCHGVFSAPESDFLSAAPPKSVAGGTSTSDPGVGAHQSHLFANIARSVKCAECHTVPSAWDDAGHITTDLRAQVVFNDSLANHPTVGVVPSPAYSLTTYQCSSVYCHGTFKNGNQTNAPTWNGQNQAACGTCHGTPSLPAPTTNHVGGLEALNCETCHIAGGVPVATYNSGSGTWSIVDTAHHVNGKLTLFGLEQSF